MILKLLFKGDKTYLATEQGEIIDNISVVNYDFNVEWMEEPGVPNPISKDISIINQQLLMQIKFEGQIGVISTDVDGTVVEVPQIEARGEA